MNRNALIIGAICIGVVSVVFCWPKYTPDQVPGTYRGAHFGGSEVIEIRRDGTFSQTFVMASKVYSSSGKWEIRGSNISFSPFLYLAHAAKFQPHETGIFCTAWDLERGKIYMGEDNDYWVTKQ